MLILRIRQAETALTDGRLDEAYKLARSQDIRQHRRGQKIIGKLARALARRARDHLANQRIPQALDDSNKAENLAGNLAEVAQLRNDICKVIEQKRHDAQKQGMKFAGAKEQIENGWLSVGEKMLVDPEGDGNHAEVLLQQATAKRLQIDAVLEKTKQALKHDDLQAAIDIIQQADPSIFQNSKAARSAAKVRALSVKQTKKDIEKGRIDLASSLLERLKPVLSDSVEVKQVAKFIDQCCQANTCLDSGMPEKAVTILKKLKNMIPSTNWLDATIKQAQQAADNIDALKTGPLGMACCDPSDIGPYSENKWTQDQRFVSSKKAGKRNKDSDMVSGAGISLLPQRFVLQIDGAGSYLVFRDRIITAGPVSSSQRPDVGLVADPDMPVAKIERVDEDYFIHSQDSIQVNSKPVKDKLLANGDRVELSLRHIMKFNLPNAASTTGCLDISSGRLCHPDIRKVILMDRDILIGPSMAEHICTAQAQSKITLYLNQDRLLCRSDEQILVNNKPLDPRHGLVMNTPIKIGQLSLVLTEFGR